MIRLLLLFLLVESVKIKDAIRLEARPCLNDCSSQLPGDRGTCVDGSCICEEMFAGPDCSISLIPEIPEEIEVKSEDSQELLLAATCTEESCLESCTYGGECITKFTCKCDAVSGRASHREDEKKEDKKEDKIITLSNLDTLPLQRFYAEIGQRVPAGDACGGGNVDVTRMTPSAASAQLHFERERFVNGFPETLRKCFPI